MCLITPVAHSGYISTAVDIMPLSGLSLRCEQAQASFLRHRSCEELVPFGSLWSLAGSQGIPVMSGVEFSNGFPSCQSCTMYGMQQNNRYHPVGVRMSSGLRSDGQNTISDQRQQNCGHWLMGII